MADLYTTVGISSAAVMRPYGALSGVRPMIETMPLSQALGAYAKMMRGDARCRMVLTMT